MKDQLVLYILLVPLLIPGVDVQFAHHYNGMIVA